MGQAFKPGDVVRLKSGGPTMTVEWIDTEYGVRVSCSWFVKETVQNRSFAPEALEIVSNGDDAALGGSR